MIVKSCVFFMRGGRWCGERYLLDTGEFEGLNVAGIGQVALDDGQGACECGGEGEKAGA